MSTTKVEPIEIATALKRLRDALDKLSNMMEQTSMTFSEQFERDMDKIKDSINEELAYSIKEIDLLRMFQAMGHRNCLSWTHEQIISHSRDLNERSIDRINKKGHRFKNASVIETAIRIVRVVNKRGLELRIT